MEHYNRLKTFVLEKLENELPNHLSYHAIDHTLDVLDVCNQYIERLNLSNKDAYLLRIGALVHDLGFLETYKNHEELGAQMAAEIMSGLGMETSEIEEVKGLILATKIPQTPTTSLQEIICDADLDYLGRDDYPEISFKLFEELMACNLISTDEEWRDLQVRFLKNHTFHTDFAKAEREPKKQFWLDKILHHSV